jgi:hypothetical protein
LFYFPPQCLPLVHRFLVQERGLFATMDYVGGGFRLLFDNTLEGVELSDFL